MAQKVAFVLDTNFIIQNLNLKKIVDDLAGKCAVYVTQTSIEERIAQRCRNIKEKFDNVEKAKHEFMSIASIELTSTFEEEASKQRKHTQAAYEKIFSDLIIPMVKNEKVYKEILDRAFMRVPPFLPGGKESDKHSDKGFKDTVIWLSMLEYFRTKGEDIIVFFTDDKGFRDNAEFLSEEFMKTTGKIIEIRENSYFKNYFEEENDDSSDESAPLPDVHQLRERIGTALSELCGFETVGYWGEDDWATYFTIHDALDIAATEKIFSSLEELIRANIFSQYISPQDIFYPCESVRVTTHIEIPMLAIENIHSIYEEVKSKFPHYLPQFFATATTMLNRNYQAPSALDDSDGELPF